MSLNPSDSYGDYECRHEASWAFSSYFQLYNYAVNGEELFKSVAATKDIDDLSIQNVFFVEEEIIPEPLYVYYVTNHGDFILYKARTDEYNPNYFLLSKSH
jgi:hypothetical protein